jgi:hypothetical protein
MMDVNSGYLFEDDHIAYAYKTGRRKRALEPQTQGLFLFFLTLLLS